MQKLLITGISGFLGWNICQTAKKSWQIHGTFLNHTPSQNLKNNYQINLINYPQLQQLFNQIKPDAIIHTAAHSQPNYCQNHPQESAKINIIVACNLAQLCAQHQIPYIFTSTDLVFNGLNPPYKEFDPVSPISIYGEQKVRAETGILQRYPQATICRMPLMFGYGGIYGKSFIQPMLETLRQGKEIALFTDEYRTPVSGTTAAEGLLLALEKNVTGILHLGGKERVSRYDFMHLLLEVLSLKTAKITRCRQQDVTMDAPRPADVSLDSSLAFSLGYHPLSLKEQFEQLQGLI